MQQEQLSDHFTKDEHRVIIISFGLAIAIASAFAIMFCWGKAAQDGMVGEGSFGESLAEYRALAAAPTHIKQSQSDTKDLSREKTNYSPY